MSNVAKAKYSQVLESQAVSMHKTGHMAKWSQEEECGAIWH